MAGRAKTWALGIKLHDPYAFGSLELYRTLLRQTFEPPRAELRNSSELLKFKQSKRDLNSYIHYMHHHTSCITANPPNDQTLITLFIQGLTDGPVRTYLFRLVLIYPGRDNPCCGTGRFQRETNSREFVFLLSLEATGECRPRIDGPPLRWE